MALATAMSAARTGTPNHDMTHQYKPMSPGIIDQSSNLVNTRSPTISVPPLRAARTEEWRAACVEVPEFDPK